MEINNMTLTKMKYILNKDDAWVSKDQIGIHVEEEHDVEEKEQCKSSLLREELNPKVQERCKVKTHNKCSF
jgi:hypothetical protein